jgi:hypothetical protein
MPPSLLGLTRWALLCCAGSPERERRGRAKVQLLKKNYHSCPTVYVVLPVLYPPIYTRNFNSPAA